MHRTTNFMIPRPAVSAASSPWRDVSQTNLLANPYGQHQKDAFMLRALLWEDQTDRG